MRTSARPLKGQGIQRFFRQLQTTNPVDQNRFTVRLAGETDDRAGPGRVTIDSFQWLLAPDSLGTGSTIANGNGAIHDGRDRDIMGNGEDGQAKLLIE